MRKYLLKSWLFILFLSGIAATNYAQTTLFSETFDEPIFATSGMSAEGVAWSGTCLGCSGQNRFDIRSTGRFVGSMTNEAAVWSTAAFDVSDCVSFRFETEYLGMPYGTDLEAASSCGTCAGDPASPGGACAGCWDFTYFELLIDGATVQSELIGDTNIPTETTVVFNECSTTGSTAMIRVTIQNDTDEFAGFDNITLICMEQSDLEISGENAICETGASTEVYGINAPGATSYSWSVSPAGAGGSLTTNSTYGVNWAAATPGTYTVSVDVGTAFGCSETFTKTVYLIDAQPAVMACNSNVNLTLDENCSLSHLVADMFLEAQQFPNNAYQVNTFDPVTGDPIVNAEDYIGQQIEVEVLALCGGNSCWGYALLEDKSIPPLDCGVPFDVDCDQITSTLGSPTNVGSPSQNADGSYTVFNYDNCGNATLRFTDISSGTLCSDPVYSSIVTRTWTITDDNGNISTCETILNINRADVNDITFPPHFDPAFGTDAIDACSNYPTLDNGSPDPDFTGRPQGVFCLNVQVGFSDIVFDGACEGEYKVIRKWTVEDVCTNEVREYTQNIAIKHPLGSLIVTCPPDQVVDQIPTNDFYNCTADWDVAPPNVIFLSPCLTVDYIVEHKIGDGSLTPPAGTPFSSDNVVTNSDGTFTIEDLPVGRHWLRYTLTSSCGHVQECFTELDVFDNAPPSAVCDLHSNIALNSDGCAYAHPETFDDGSFSCSDVSLKIRRLTPGSCGMGSQTSFTDVIKFCCADANSTVQIELQATSANGQTSTCVVEAFIQDFSSASFSPPSNTSTSLSCNGSINLSSQSSLEGQFGAPSFSAALCGGSWNEVLPASMSSTGDCGMRTITRTWRFTNGAGNVSTHTQTISVSLSSPFNGNDITWPGDVTLTGCKTTPVSPVSPDDIANVNNRRPTWNADDCSDVISTYDDTPFYYIEGVCVKILRKWTVVDWCQATSFPGSGQWSYTQIIKVDDTSAPNITSGCSLPTFVNGEDANCGQIVSFSATANDNCPEQMSWTASIDGVTRSITFANGEAQINDVSLDAGSHTICWSVEDACGNTDDCCENFQIQDNKPPTPACVTILTTVISNPNSPTLIWASDFDASSSDDCSNNNQLDFAFSTNPFDQSLALTCADIANGVVDTIPVNIYVFDAAGNYDFCEAMLVLQDNSDFCTDTGNGNRIDLSGDIMTESDEMVDEVMVSLSMENSTPFSYMAYDGLYAFNDLDMYDDYQVEASKNDDYTNGVSTIDLILIQKHLLQVQLLDSPYKVIAADINDSGKVSAVDLIELRKLILGIYNELPNNDSWRFVDADQTFADVLNPFPFNDELSFTSLDSDIDDANFVAVKIGDVNESVELNSAAATTANRSDKMVFDLAVAESTEGTYNYNISLDENQTLQGLQFTVQYDAGKMNFKNIESSLINLTEANHALIEEGLLTFSWSELEATNIAANSAFLTIQFEANSDKNNISLTSSITNAEVYSLEGNTIVTKGIELRSNVKDTFVLHQNVPNPFNANTVIGFELPASSEVNLTVYDATGKVIFAKSDEYSKGYNEIAIDANSLPNSGILYYQLDSYTHSATKKMILLK